MEKEDREDDKVKEKELEEVKSPRVEKEHPEEKKGRKKREKGPLKIKENLGEGNLIQRQG